MLLASSKKSEYHLFMSRKVLSNIDSNRKKNEYFDDFHNSIKSIILQVGLQDVCEIFLAFCINPFVLLVFLIDLHTSPIVPQNISCLSGYECELQFKVTF